MKQRFYILLCAILIASLLGGCRAGLRNAAGGLNNTAAEPTWTSVPTAEVLATVVPQPTALPTTTAVPQTDAAAQAAKDYFAALEKADFTDAVSRMSSFSLAVVNMSSGDATTALERLKTAGGKWSQLQVLDTRPFDDLTVLVHVRYQYTQLDEKTKQPVTSERDELWPVRNESGTWRYNWGNLIDFRTLTTDAQTLSGITILPQKLMRYSDRIQLVMLMQNSTNAPFVFGQTNEILAQFHFGDQVIPAQKTQIVLNPLRSAPDVAFDLPGLYQTFPDSVEIRKWQNLKVPAWFTFELNS